MHAIMELQISFSAISSFIILFFFLSKLVKELKSSKTKNTITKLPPGPRKLPFLGNILQAAGAVPHRILGALATKHGPLMHLQLGEISAVVISSPDMAKEALKGNDLAIADRPDLLLGRVMLANSRDIVLALYGDYWRQMRKICTLEILSAQKVRSFRSIREDEASHLIRSIQSSLESPVNVSEKLSALANGITCRATIGKRCKYQDELIKLVDDIAYWGSGFFLADLFPSLKFLPVLTGMKPSLDKMRKKLDLIFNNIIEDHKEKMASRKEQNISGSEDEDLIDVLLRINQTQRLEFPLTSLDIQGIILDMFTAGTGSSSAALEWAMSELINNPKAMEKAQAEVREACKGKEQLCETDIQGLSYLKQVIKETLRMHPPVPLLLPRECREQCQIDGYTIPVKTKVLVNAWMIGRDPEYWVDPDNFTPERFENSSIDYIGANFGLIPFGAGRRMCPGIAFGIATIELPLAQLLYHFDWKLPNGMKPGDLDMDENSGANTKRKNHLFLIPTNHFKSQN